MARKTNRSRKANLSEGAYSNKLEYNKNRNHGLSNHTTYFPIDSEVGKQISAQPNKTKYLTSLIEADMKK